TEPALPEDFRPRGATTDATPRPEFDLHNALPPRSRHRERLAAKPMLREIDKSGHEYLITQ
ncbi:MAG: hypothetical protein ACYC2E_10195, partial [Sulfuricella sp.]